MRLGGVLGTAVLVCATAASGAGEALPKPQFKPGLWVIERYSNIPLFLAPPKNEAEVAAKSEALLRQPGIRHAFCLDRKALESLTAMEHPAKHCTTKPPVFTGGHVIIDGVCDKQTMHMVESVSAPGGFLTAIHTEIVDPADPKKGAVIDVDFRSPTHITIKTVSRLPTGSHVPMQTFSDITWQGADCGDLEPGKSRPLKKTESVR